MKTLSLSDYSFTYLITQKYTGIPTQKYTSIPNKSILVYWYTF